MSDGKSKTLLRLFPREDELMAAFEQKPAGSRRLQAEEPNDAVPVRLVYARPVSARGQGISVMDAKGKKELAWLPSLEALDDESCRHAEEMLWKHYRIAQVHQILESVVNHGHRYLRVRTDRGDRHFNLREPGNNVTYLSGDQVVIRDSMGNRYEIPSVSALDEASQIHLERVL